ncbi:MAG: hypothetical protein A2297_09615 [Elusimicrobia bacterium RIFOXYB2_FULL_48_7]|nr:MAG: hypothetical protein A2297_09615 [Elusimicrobia bacterium RIFOXYB2_FULL_48_7]
MCDGTSSFDGNVIPFGQPGAGYPCLDQIGRGPGTELLSGVTVQKSEPVYLWNNTVNGSPSGLIINTGCSARPLQIVENRDYYNGIPRPGYTPYTYPHPMAIDDADTSSPTAPGAVYDGTGTDINCAFSTTTLAANWTAGSDNESGISCYQYAISAVSAGGTEFAGWTNITNSPVVRTGLALNPGVTYYFTVKTVNGVGLVSNPANSNGQYVSLDATPPGAPAAVRDGTINGIDISSTTSTTQLSANWDASADAESGISDYRYAIGTSPSAQDVVGWTTTAGLLSITKTGLVLNAGATYYFSVKAVNGAGVLSAASNSNGQVVVVISTADSTLPIMGPVRDGTGTDIASSIAGGQLSANWDAAVDAESGVSSYRYAIGTSAGVADTVAWTNLGNVLTVTRGGLSLTAGTTYYFNVKAINGVGLISTAANSNGQYVVAIDTSDTTPPSAPAVVRDGAVAGADINSTTDTAQLSANWDASADAESGIAGYWYAIGSTPGDTDIRGWTDNGPLTNVTASGLTLTVGVTYYISVQAENGVGLQSAAANSNGQVVVAPDTTGPAVSAVAAQNITQTGATIIWTTDEPSTSQVEYGRSISYGRVTIDNPAMDTAHSVALPELIAGSVYHYRIISRDASNNETTSGDYTFTTSAAAGPIPETIHAYPNPCKISPAAPIKFRAGSGNISEVGIYTVSGRLIKRLSAVPGASSAEINWDGANADGQKVSRGIYIYKLTSSAGDTITGKIVLK